MIERKRSLDELGANFAHGNNRTRLEEELSTFKGKKYLLLENATYKDICEKNYENKVSVKAFLGTLHQFNHRYNWEVTYMPNNQYSAPWIYGTCYYYLRNLLRT